MGPYEVAQPGGSVEHMNEEAGAVWLARLAAAYPAAAWLNAVTENQRGHSPSTRMIGELMAGRMYPLTLAGLDEAMR